MAKPKKTIFLQTHQLEENHFNFTDQDRNYNMRIVVENQMIIHTWKIIIDNVQIDRHDLSCTLRWYIYVSVTHYRDVIMSAVTSQTSGVSIVYSTVCSGVDQIKQKSSASLASVRGIHQWPVNSPHKGTVTQKMLPHDHVIIYVQVWE